MIASVVLIALAVALCLILLECVLSLRQELARLRVELQRLRLQLQQIPPKTEIHIRARLPEDAEVLRGHLEASLGHLRARGYSI